MTVKKFEVGTVYYMHFIGDSNLKPEFICVKRTAKTVTFEAYKNPNEKLTRRIKEYNGAEYVLDGNYSMAPSISADRPTR